MGLMSLLGMMEVIDDVNQLVEWHLSSNIYPPVNPIYVPLCVEAIRALKNQADGTEKVMLQMPEGTFHKNDQTFVDAWDVVEGFALEGFLMEDEYEHED